MPTGLWIIGARGSVATAATLGRPTLRGRLAAPTGCLTELSPFAGSGLPGWSDLVVGGHATADHPLREKAESPAGAGVGTVPAGRRTRRRTHRRRGGVTPRATLGRPSGPGPAAAVAAVRAALDDFTRRHRLDRTAVAARERIAATEVKEFLMAPALGGAGTA